MHLLTNYLYLEYYKKDITDRYCHILTNITIDRAVLNDMDGKIYITTFEKYIQMQQENKQLKEEYKELKDYINRIDKLNEAIPKSKIKDLLREVQDYDLSYKDEILFKLLQKLLESEE